MKLTAFIYVFLSWISETPNRFVIFRGGHAIKLTFGLKSLLGRLENAMTYQHYASMLNMFFEIFKGPSDPK